MEPCLENVKSSRKSKEEKKLLRKQIKASHVLLKHEGISTVSQPTQSLVVANGGLGNGVSREQLLAVLKEGGEVETLVMPPHKPYALVTYRSQDCAQRAHALLNSRQLCCGDQSVALYLSFIDSVVSEREACVSLPPGLLVVEDYVTPEEETVLLDAIDWSSHDDDVTAQKALKHRRVKHYGYEFRYDNNNVDKDKPLPGGLPQPCVAVLERCLKDGHVSSMPDQLTVNQYQSGQGIPPHVDTHSAFEDSILSLSLGAKTVMEFRHPDGRQVAVVLPGRSLLVMKGESRHLWTHGITPRKFDVVPACDPQSPAIVTSDLSNHGNLTLSKRGTRTSLTFRKIRFTPCDCSFPSACDSQRPAPAPASPPSLPRCPSEAARLEEQYVHRVYDSIAAHFSGTRHSPWPRVCHFLSRLPPGGLVADLGCGNGKYLGVNPDVITVGCDHSSVLVQICLERGHLAFVSDALSVPLRSETYDACISIAVIHHFSTQERRLEAVRELTRLLKPGGRALIYVWALEQEHNKQRSKYLREPQGPSGTATDASTVHSIQEAGRPTGNGQDYKKQPAGTEDTSASVQVSPGKESSTKLSVHTNRTAFNSQDLLVPWHLKGGGEERRRKEGVKGKGGGEERRRKEGVKGKGGGEERRRKEGVKGKGGGGGGPRNTPEPCSNADLQTSVSSPDPKHDHSPKTGPVFHRFYHVFQQGELERLCGRVRGVRVESSYHDQGNWCVILEKTTGDC